MDIPPDIRGFADIEQFLHIEFALESSLDNRVDTTDFPFDDARWAYDHFGVAMEVAFYPAIYADVFL